jgi:3-dehydroquinate dehydratase I
MICVSLGNISFDQCKKLIADEDLAEIRIDLLQLTENELVDLVKVGKKVVATCRKNERFSDSERIKWLKIAIEAQADYVDIEYEAPKDFKNQVIEVAKQHNCDVIISYHNFEKTPELDELKKIVTESFQMGANVAKLATMANDRMDNVKMLSLYEEDKRLVAICMGNLGKISRILAPYFRAEFTFAALVKQQGTAPGQLTKIELVDMINRLNKL